MHIICISFWMNKINKIVDDEALSFILCSGGHSSHLELPTIGKDVYRYELKWQDFILSSDLLFHVESTPDQLHYHLPDTLYKEIFAYLGF